MNRDDKKTSELAAIRDELPKFAPLVKDDQVGVPDDEVGSAGWSPDVGELLSSEPEVSQEAKGFVPNIDLELDDADKADAEEDDAEA